METINITGNGNITLQDVNTKETCRTCKYYVKNNRFNGECERLRMMILKPEPKSFTVRNEFYCNEHVKI